MKVDKVLEQVYEPILPSLKRVEEEIVERLTIDYDFPLKKYITMGKRLRPAALLFMARAYSGLERGAIILATAIELIHASSLIHDDIVDEAQFRRDNLALNYRFGNSVAVLAGDFVFSRAIMATNELRNPDIMDVFLSSVLIMVEGEFLEEILRFEDRLKEEFYYRVIYKKTASLFEASFKLGALWRKMNRDTQELARKIGYNFGMAYQVIDDCEDLFSDTDSDISLEKITLPVIGALLNSNDHREITLDMELEELKRFVFENRGFDYALKKASNFIEEGKSLVRELPDPDVVENLSNFFDYLDHKREKVLESIATTSI